jgi:predicted RND superfamily exporter protein
MLFIESGFSAIFAIAGGLISSTGLGDAAVDMVFGDTEFRTDPGVASATAPTVVGAVAAVVVIIALALFLSRWYSSFFLVFCSMSRSFSLGLPKAAQ